LEQGGIDDAIRAMEEDTEGATKLPPIQYAKLRGIYPQKVYAALRNRKLAWGWCDCGRKVVVIEEADEYFKLGKWKRAEQAEETEEEVPGSNLDTDGEVS
jgi:hypothetical protein